MGQKFLGQLGEGDRFKTKYGSAIYTIGKRGTITDHEGKDAYYPKQMPVIHLRQI